MARLRAVLPAAALLLALTGCSGVWVPEAVENRVGEQVTRSVLKTMPPLSDPRWQQYVEGLGRKIVAVSERPNYHYRFYVVDSDAINAFAVPDGSIFVTTGLLKLVGQDQLALAGVLAHEVGHVARRHGAETIQRQMGFGTLRFLVFGFEGSALADLTGQIVGLGYGREMELEADLCAMRYLTRLGYPPDASLGFLRSLLVIEKDQPSSVGKYLLSHPPTADRIRYAEDYTRQYLKTKNP